jgi:hypothetical protein
LIPALRAGQSPEGVRLRGRNYLLPQGRRANFSAAGIVKGSTNDRSVMAEATETPVWREDEQSKVESWRLHVLIEAGFPLPLAERLAASEADLHVCVKLLSSGCSPVTAAEILL